MSREFIEKGYNSSSLAKAVRQERQLSYFTISKLEEDNRSVEWAKQWFNRNYQSSDYFLNWVKTIFKQDNFLSFAKYLRYPLPSAKLCKNRIEPQLKRVFNAEDSDFKYTVQGVEESDFIEDLKIKKFNADIFERLLYKHNSLIVTDLDAVIENTPYRYFIDIDKVVSLTHDDNVITKIAYWGTFDNKNGCNSVYIVIDSKTYSIYSKDKDLLFEVDHDLGSTPVHFISPTTFDFDFVIRQSLFTYVREELEEYVFLKTLQKMTDTNGAFPVAVKIKESNGDDDNSTDGGTSENIMGSQRAQINNENQTNGGELGAGSIISVPAESLMDEQDKIDPTIIEKYIKFHYVPVEVLDYINGRVASIEKNIISEIVGDFLESSEASKNESQIEKSVSVLENTLTSFSEGLNRIRKLSDYDMLGLKYVANRIQEIFIHYGTDFFLDTEERLYNQFEKSANSLERRNIITRINQNRYKNNLEKYSRYSILSDLMPYVSDKDFEMGKAAGVVDEITSQYQIRFTYWIGIFEAKYGDIVVFYANAGETKQEKLLLINNLIIEIIKESTGISSDPTIEDEDGGNDVNEQIKIEAQSRLKGTVGGVDGILGLQEKIAAGIT